MFLHAINTPLTAVSYRGTGPAMTDLLGGQFDLMCDQTTTTAAQIKAGKIKGYAVTTWYVIFGPAGMPANVFFRERRV